MSEEITQLTEKWWEESKLRGGKDYDYHWWIEIRWSYGYPPVYTAVHQGGFAGRIEKEFNYQDAAESYLVAQLKKALQELKKIDPE